MDDEVTVTAVPDYNRYEVRLGGELVGFADYMDRDNQRLFTHTEIDPGVGKRGIGNRLVRFALEDTRESGRRVVPVCSFVAHVAGES
jgi:predicted GNAT family acetyltransferase